MRSLCINGSYALMGIGVFLSLVVPIVERPFSGILFDPIGILGFISSFIICIVVNIFLWAGLWFRWYIDRISGAKEQALWMLWLMGIAKLLLERIHAMTLLFAA